MSVPTKFPTISVLCDSVGAYNKACADSSRPINWRNENFCPVRCPSNSHYDYCGSECVDSCTEGNRASKCKSSKCTEGCFCNAGYLWDGVGCIKKSNCGCVNGDLSYKIGEVFYKKDCAAKCKCVGVNKQECSQDYGCRNSQECIAEPHPSTNPLSINNIKLEPLYTCKPRKPNRSTGGDTGSSFHLGQRPSNDDEALEDDFDLGMNQRAKNKTKPIRPGRIQNDPFGGSFIPMGPQVEFPDCLPKLTWRTGQVKPDWIPPNKCCGNRPYSDMVLVNIPFLILIIIFPAIFLL